MSEQISPRKNGFEIEKTLAAWAALNPQKRGLAFGKLKREDADDFFLHLSTILQAELLEQRPVADRRSLLRLLEPDDAADVIQKFPADERAGLLDLLDHDTKNDVTALMAYAEDDAGGLMNPRFVRLRPDIAVDVAIRYLRAQRRATIGTIQYIYVLTQEQVLVGVLSFRELLLAPAESTVNQLMRTEFHTIPENMDQEEVSRRFAQSHLLALPVIDEAGRMKGVVTIDDVVHVVQETATEDIQKMGGSEALDDPYLQAPLFQMIKKRAGWLTVLFLGEMLTATAMGFFEKEIEKAVVLALFVPLIISSGGNSGSQATSLIIRSLALGEIKLRDWWRVFTKEVLSGLALGVILGTIGFCRIMVWPTRNTTYGPHYFLVALTVGLSLIGIVLWGSVAGSMLPFILRRLGFDPATASAPFVATLVDVTGLIIYFSVASLTLGGVLL